jgi:topoisomerase-4 subunit A
MKEKGISTLGGRKVWWDEVVMRLNADGRGKFLGEFVGSDQILVVTKNGFFRTSNFDLSNHYEDNVLLIEKFRPEKIFSASYFDADQNYYYVKRFTLEESEKPQCLIGENPDSRLIQLSEVEYPRLEVRFGGKNKGREPEIIEVADFIGVKSFKARGKRLSTYEVSIIKELEPLMREIQPLPLLEKPDDSPPDPDSPSIASQMSLDL